MQEAGIFDRTGGKRGANLKRIGDFKSQFNFDIAQDSQLLRSPLLEHAMDTGGSGPVSAHIMSHSLQNTSMAKKWKLHLRSYFVGSPGHIIWPTCLTASRSACGRRQPRTPLISSVPRVPAGSRREPRAWRRGQILLCAVGAAVAIRASAGSGRPRLEASSTEAGRYGETARRVVAHAHACSRHCGLGAGGRRCATRLKPRLGAARCA
jgi:hypothetical protein